MKTFTYVIKDELGIHARPAGLLVKVAKNFNSEIFIKKNEKSVNAVKLMALMGLGVKCGDTVTVNVSGSDEESASQAMEEFFKKADIMSA